MFEIIKYIIFTAIIGTALFYATLFVVTCVTLLCKKFSSIEQSIGAFLFTFLFVIIHYFVGITVNTYSKLVAVAIYSLIASVIAYFVLKKKYAEKLTGILKDWHNISSEINENKKRIKNMVLDHLSNIGPATGREIIDENDFSFYKKCLGYKNELEELFKTEFKTELIDIDCFNNIKKLPTLEELIVKDLNTLATEYKIILKVVLYENGREGELETNLYESVRGEHMESETFNFDDL